MMPPPQTPHNAAGDYFKLNEVYERQFIISEEIYCGFIKLFQDRNPLHTNQQFAMDKGFRNTVMHGNILNGFISYFIGECLPITDVIIHSQEISYKKPVYLHDIVRLNVIVSEIHESVNAVVFKFKFFNQTQEMIAKGIIQIGILL